MDGTGVQPQKSGTDSVDAVPETLEALRLTPGGARPGLDARGRPVAQNDPTALVTGDTDFLNRLDDSGACVRERHNAPAPPGRLRGRAPGHRSDIDERPVWFSGSTLACDLSLPGSATASNPPGPLTPRRHCGWSGR
ncbi:hypothetical protein Sfulv_59040 [Streptomyces fulvorobeus]|uniref:Uncharacterized protein n=1 Tax=Streptomyces fulvorobeus TaxID=284028 RepID=A0A7J0CGQ1_9ACTN|nr:hypothetical protein Sfulv_59040 [Streptomyces fulvorobeus]